MSAVYTEMPGLAVKIEKTLSHNCEKSAEENGLVACICRAFKAIRRTVQSWHETCWISLRSGGNFRFRFKNGFSQEKPLLTETTMLIIWDMSHSDSAGTGQPETQAAYGLEVLCANWNPALPVVAEHVQQSRAQTTMPQHLVSADVDGFLDRMYASQGS